MINIENLSAGYDKKQILYNISLSLPKGKLISVIGPNGSGKSTLLKSTVGIIKPFCGDIFIDNQKTDNMSRKEIARKTAYLAQGKGTPDMTVLQMVLHGRFPHLSYPRRYSDNDRKIAFSALKQTGISELAERHMSSLSGGMRQNAYIAMALAQDADYILLDEPTSFLDISHQLELMKTLRGLADRGKGIVSVLHDLPLAFTFSDSIIIIKEGRIILCDTPKAICASGIVKDIFGVELYYSADENNYFYKYLPK
ncbi:MAG: ABC transporter ATP-binding protein [Clostridia bacterium]|nr:ABC transporter ATP-binding protein [Clostridia bacterium]